MELNGHNLVASYGSTQVTTFPIVDAEVVPFDMDSREVVKPDITEAQVKAIMAELAQAQAENAKLKAEREQKMTLTLKVSEKGGISVYGLGRFPVTLYSEQWEKIGKIIPQIEAFSKAQWKEIDRLNKIARAAKAEKK